ncbi:MAG: alpha/beta hydrolase [Nitrososphaeraceae archaeon]|nr:alpha/beta hydrolase [Nitrososphaeraceae archaeon]
MSKENKTNKIKNNGSLDFVHRFIPASVTMTKNNKNKSPVLLLLHGTGGSEDDLIPIGKMLCEDCALLSPRGKVTENGMPRFFRRLAEGIFDTEDLLYRTQELADFVKNASRFYGFDLNKVIVVGFSNGANIAASMILLRPEVVSGAILFRAMVPFEPEPFPDLSNKFILLSEGLHDPIVSKQEVERLFAIIKKSGAKLTLRWQNSGHNLTEKDIMIAKEWLDSFS